MAAEQSMPNCANLTTTMEAVNEAPAAPVAATPENGGITAGMLSSLTSWQPHTNVTRRDRPVRPSNPPLGRPSPREDPQRLHPPHQPPRPRNRGSQEPGPRRHKIHHHRRQRDSHTRRLRLPILPHRILHRAKPCGGSCTTDSQLEPKSQCCG